MRSCLQARGVTSGGEGVTGEVTPFLAGRQWVSTVPAKDPAFFCTKTLKFSCADVYRKSAGSIVPAKYLAKCLTRVSLPECQHSTRVA
jgi:hypothetical protein